MTIHAHDDGGFVVRFWDAELGMHRFHEHAFATLGDARYRCEAILSPGYIAGDWRCSRWAVDDGLCRQHAKLGARVPHRWEPDERGHDRPQGGIVNVLPRACNAR